MGTGSVTDGELAAALADEAGFETTWRDVTAAARALAERFTRGSD